MYLHGRFVFFWRKEIGIKAANKMLVKLTEERKSQKFWKSKTEVGVAVTLEAVKTQCSWICKRVNIA